MEIEKIDLEEARIRFDEKFFDGKKAVVVETRKPLCDCGKEMYYHDWCDSVFEISNIYKCGVCGKKKVFYYVCYDVDDDFEYEYKIAEVK